MLALKLLGIKRHWRISTILPTIFALPAPNAAMFRSIRKFIAYLPRSDDHLPPQQAHAAVPLPVMHSQMPYFPNRQYGPYLVITVSNVRQWNLILVARLIDYMPARPPVEYPIHDGARSQHPLAHDIQQHGYVASQFPQHKAGNDQCTTVGTFSQQPCEISGTACCRACNAASLLMCSSYTLVSRCRSV